MNKFSLSIIPKKYKKVVSMADIKQYLVEEFDNNKKMQNEIYKLQDELKLAKEFEVKYNLSLVTLDEFKRRLEDKADRTQQLNDQIKVLQETIKKQKYEINDLKLENKKMEKYINNIEQNIRKDIKKEYKEKINNLKGHLKKEELLKLI